MAEQPSYEELEQRIRELKSEILTCKQALKASNDVEVKYQTLFNNAEDVILIIDTKGNLLEANRVFGVKSGYNREQLIGENLTKSGILTKESATFVISKLKDIIEERTSASFEIHTLRSGGQIVPYDAKATPIKRNPVLYKA